MRTEKNLLEGTTVVVEHPEELSRLRRPLRDLVSPSAHALFEGFPGSLEELAARAKRKTLAGALRRLAGSKRCELQIHRPGRRGGGAAEAYVRVGEHPVLLSGGLARIPARCPPALAEVLRLVGVVRVEYGSALGLVAPSEQVSLSKLAAEYETYYPGGLADLPMPKAPNTFFTFYESSGAYVCTNAAGATWKFSLTGGDYGKGPALATWLDRFFDAGPFGPKWDM